MVEKNKSGFSLDTQLFGGAVWPDFLADTNHPVCAITYPVNLASQGDF